MKRIFARTDATTTRATLQLFRQEFFRNKTETAIFLILIPLGHILRFVVIPLLISFVIQSLIQHPHDPATPLQLIGGIAFSMIISTICNDKGYTILFNHDEAAQTRLLENGLRNLMNRSYQFFTDQKVGTLAGDLTNYSHAYVSLMDNYFLNTNHLIVSFIFSLVIIGFLSPILLIPTLLITAVLIVLNIRNIRQRGPYRNKRKELTSKLTGSIADVMGNQLLVRIFSREEEESREINRERSKIEAIARKEIAIIEHESMLRQTFLFTFQLLTLLLFVWLNAQNLASIAAIIFTFTYINRSTDAIFAISGVVRQYEQAFLDATPMVRILQAPLTVVNAPDAKKLHVEQGRIDFRKVSFSYTDAANDAVFEKLEFTIPPGQRVGLAGYSGGGKTTLTKLLLRFSDIDKGEILIDDQNIANTAQESLRSQISYVPQDPFLFHRSLRENIAYGKPGAADKEVIDAAKKAHAWEFIKKLPNGLDTIVGERGVKLSGGQRQRVAIARAILKDAPILILDEATSALDSESEKLIQQSLETLMKDRTSIVIAHRLSTIAKLDRIIVLDNGTITEDGTHAELLKQNGTYAKLWLHQSGGFIED